MNPSFLNTKITVLYKTTEWSEIIKQLELVNLSCLITCEDANVIVYTISNSDPAIGNLVKTKVAEKDL